MRAHTSWYLADVNNEPGNYSVHYLCRLRLITILGTTYKFYPWLTDKNLRHTEFEKRAKFTQLLRLKPNSILSSLSHYTFLSLHGKWPVTCGLGRQLKTGWWKKDGRTGEWMDRYVPWLKYLYQSKGQSLTFFFLF